MVGRVLPLEVVLAAYDNGVGAVWKHVTQLAVYAYGVVVLVTVLGDHARVCHGRGGGGTLHDWKNSIYL